MLNLIRFAVMSCALFTLHATAQPPKDDKPPAQKRTPAQQAIKDARTLLEKARGEMKTDAERLRIDIAISALESSPHQVIVIQFDKEAAFDDGLLRYRLDSISFAGGRYTLTYTVTNSSDKPASVAAVAGRLRRCTLVDPGSKMHSPAEVETKAKGGLAGNGEIRFLTVFSTDHTEPRVMVLDFYGYKEEGFTRIIVPADKVKK